MLKKNISSEIKSYRIYSGICHGTLGELFQGPYVVNGKNIKIAIISLPVQLFSYAHFFLDKQNDFGFERSKNKSMLAAQIYLQYYGKEMPCGTWWYSSELKEGKGMASSTADIVATIRCLDSIFGYSTDNILISSILRDIERSDSVFLNQYALYLSGQQSVVECFQNQIQLWCCYIDEDNIVDTENTTNYLLRHYKDNISEYNNLLGKMRSAFHKKNLEMICSCSTESSRLSQLVLPKKNYLSILEQQVRFNADGIFVAHTGSLIGYLFKEKPSIETMGELSSFLMSLGYQCKFIQTGIS